MDVGTKSYISHQEQKMTATVEQIESWIVDVPTIRPHKLSMTTMGCQSLVIVRLTRSDGICGIGEATTIGGLSYGVESPEAILSAITHYLTPLLKGQPADNLNALTARMNGAIKGNTFAKSAIETALLDAQGKALGLPVSALLGGALQTALPVLWTLASGDTAKDIAEGEKLLAEGRHRAFKLKIGARELATDLRHTRAIVEALGDRASIRVDVNQAWDAATGAKGCRELAAMGVDLIEQPVSAHDNAALVRLSQQIETASLADEAVATAYDGYQLAQQGFTGAYALKIAKAGGPNSVLALARVAQAAGIGLYGGTMLEGTVGTVASLHAWSTLPLQWGTEMFGPLLLKDDIVSVPLTFADGQVALPQTPGLGVELDEDKLHFYTRQP
ncbi:muconate cycloisomerase family protein [Klebsiella pneumoniae]|uniref:muconate cycloisomerase family protein n=1 Tax=Klebsiella pneumoniae TaxID=573 RepID=UPI00155915A7|nr:muconate cycloisomerase family protein [Klebsiella pneumoniae]ELA2521336.1 muconate cycloisomerase family protein [Klebsiella pneumoniae]ELT0550130.1 muconate cycloisomerase family protein [Klebsiella pneumoniae]MBC9988419.1 muconate cycloisomerase family protein [Klebsiella pneumoniae]MBC9993668.1 muconate cycloisomerase family protein [Klebsiella pneumoniae]MDW7482359.1 muconate cycloisomerase family protein [Klebsiella pneumoniae]